MGSRISLDDQKRRAKLEEELTVMERNLSKTATAHYTASEFYSQLDIKLKYASYITGILGTSGGVLSKLAWKTMAQNYPRLGPVAATTAATMSLFAVLVNIPNLPNSPAALHQMHFRAGIECQYLRRRVGFFAKTDVWNTSIPWTTLASRYENLLKEKKEVNSRVQSEAWAYRATLNEECDGERKKVRGKE